MLDIKIRKTTISKINTNVSFSKVCAYVLICAPIIFYYFCAYIYAVNIPFWDDYDSLRQQIQFSDANDIKEKISILFSQHNEHRIAFNRIIFAFYELLFQEINFKLLPLVGNLALLILLFFFWKNLQSSPHKLLIFVPIPLLLFQLQNWKNMTWTLASLSNYFVLSFASVCFYFLCKGNNKNLISGFLFGTASVFTQGSGMGVFPLSWCYLLTIKKYKESFYWLAAFIIVIAIYFIGYEKPGHHPSVWEALKNQGQLWGYLFVFLGGFIYFSKKIAFLFGFVFFVSFLFLTYKKYYLKKPAIYLFIAFIILAGCMAALTRSGFGWEQAFSQRYKIISILLAISFYIVLADWLFSASKKRQIILFFMIGTSIIFYCFQLKVGIESLKAHRMRLIEGLELWATTGTGLYYPVAPFADETVSLAMQKGLYKFPAKLMQFDSKKLPQKQNPENKCQGTVVNPQKIRLSLSVLEGNSEDLLRLKGHLFRPFFLKKSDLENIFIVLKSKKENLYFSIHHVAKLMMNAPAERLRTNEPYISLIHSKFLSDGLFEVGICQKNELFFSTKKLFVDNGKISLLN